MSCSRLASWQFTPGISLIQPIQTPAPFFTTAVNVVFIAVSSLHAAQPRPQTRLD
jgi:hypothetical protein